MNGPANCPANQTTNSPACTVHCSSALLKGGCSWVHIRPRTLRFVLILSLYLYLGFGNGIGPLWGGGARIAVPPCSVMSKRVRIISMTLQEPKRKQDGWTFARKCAKFFLRAWLRMHSVCHKILTERYVLQSVRLLYFVSERNVEGNVRTACVLCNCNEIVNNFVWSETLNASTVYSEVGHC